jgi:hypothetical protein
MENYKSCIMRWLVLVLLGIIAHLTKENREMADSRAQVLEALRSARAKVKELAALLARTNQDYQELLTEAEGIEDDAQAAIDSAGSEGGSTGGGSGSGSNPPPGAQATTQHPAPQGQPPQQGIPRPQQPPQQFRR